MNDLAGVVFMIMIPALTMLMGFSWYRETQRRRRAEERLWAFASAHGIAIPPFDDTPAMIAGHAPRVDRLEAQIDSMSQQIDRLAETQEFLSRVLTDRIEQIGDPRLKTPH